MHRQLVHARTRRICSLIPIYGFSSHLSFLSREREKKNQELKRREQTAVEERTEDEQVRQRMMEEENKSRNKCMEKHV